MKLYLVRHGETEWNRMRKLQGQTDIPLNENGIRQAQELAERLREYSFEGIVCSPLLRARQTAEQIFSVLKKEECRTDKPDRPLWLKENPLLMEQDYGSANGRLIAFSDEEWKTWYQTYGDGGETDGQFGERMERAAEAILSYPAKALLVVSHGAVISQLAELFTGQNHPVSGIGNGEILCLEVEADRTGRYLYREQKKMELGYTTGSCAAAAAKAAVWMLVHREYVYQVSLMTPKKIPLLLELSQVTLRKEEASCTVCKNGGDDPDVTSGMMIGAAVRFADGTEGEHGYRIPLRDGRVLYLDGGEGIGRVTRGGLADPVGYAAINPVPRRMIASCVEQVMEEYRPAETAANVCSDGGRDDETQMEQGGKKDIHVCIFAPEGGERAKKTFNPHLGIEGGISILGTTGIVEPMSERALVETIRVDMEQKVRLGAEVLPVVLGNYGEEFLRSQSPDRSDGLMGEAFFRQAVKCSNFIGETVDYAAALSVKGILLTGHIGKLIKLAGGIMNTHSRYADARMEILASCALMEGADAELARKILAEVTTDGGLALCAQAGIGKRVMERAAKQCVRHLMRRCRGEMKMGVVVFSTALSLTGEAGDVDELRHIIQEQWVQNGRTV